MNTNKFSMTPICEEEGFNPHFILTILADTGGCVCDGSLDYCEKGEDCTEEETITSQCEFTEEEFDDGVIDILADLLNNYIDEEEFTDFCEKHSDFVNVCLDYSDLDEYPHTLKGISVLYVDAYGTYFDVDIHSEEE